MFKMRKVKKFQDPNAFSCQNASNDLIKKLPLKFIQSNKLLAKVRTRCLNENDLPFACNIILKLAGYEGMDTGYYCIFNKSILIPKSNGNEDIYLIKDCEVTCSKGDLEEIKTMIENNFFEKYKIRIKLDLN
jgi:hypothetical protein